MSTTEQAYYLVCDNKEAQRKKCQEYMVEVATRWRGSYHRLQQENQIKSIHVRTLLLT
jgi:hypothetical protein